MSSRALRKLQREQETKRQLEQATAEEEQAEDEVEDEDPATSQAKTSMFAMLGEEQGDDDDEDEDEAEQPDTNAVDDEKAPVAAEQSIASKSKAKKKKKKKAKSAKAVESQGANGSSEKRSNLDGAQLDEIDLALRELALKRPVESESVKEENATDPRQADVQRLLSVDSQNLHAANEMRRLFGRVALEDDQEPEQPARGGRRGRGAQQMGLAEAARQGGGRGGLATLSLKRNLFIQGKEDWPRAPGGGLGMEIVEKRPDGTIEYRFSHNRMYQDVQRQFDSCVASMDPQRIIQLLHYNPYHISTLLQVSEIAKQERDHATSGTMLERALFSFGRAVHSTFGNSLSQGKARLDFRRPENREFWLAGWRYIGNLSMRATWRTVYEWAKLLLSLDPDNDPYCMTLVIDQYALRAKQAKQFAEVAQNEHFVEKWHEMPNIQLSLGLALVQSGEGAAGRQQLIDAIEDFPWIAARLCQELNLEPIPPPIWGKQPRTPYEKLTTEMYVIRGKDIWNTPEATGLLMEVAYDATPSDIAPFDYPISVNVARHTLLTENTALISLIPRALTSRLQSTSDPLPPDENLPSYDTASSTSISRNATNIPTNPVDILREFNTLQNFFQQLLPWFRTTNGGGVGPENGAEPTADDVHRRIAESGIAPEEIMRRTERMQELQQAIQRLDEEDDHSLEVREEVRRMVHGREEEIRRAEETRQAHVEDDDDEDEDDD